MWRSVPKFSFNVFFIDFLLQGQQYVCAGELVALQAMTNVLNYLKVQKIDIAKVYSFHYHLYWALMAFL